MYLTVLHFVPLQPLVTLKGVHNIFVTGLAFLPDSQLVNNQLRNEFAVLSISADNTCKVTTLKRRGMVSADAGNIWLNVNLMFICSSICLCASMYMYVCLSAFICVCVSHFLAFFFPPSLSLSLCSFLVSYQTNDSFTTKTKQTINQYNFM